MKKFTKEVNGSISLFLSMVILLLVILEGFLIDGSKVLAGKMFLSSAGDMALNAGLTYYDEALRDIYGLFATCKTDEELKENLQQYFQQTLGDATGVSDPGYVDSLLEYVNASIVSGWDGQEAGKLLDLRLGDFEVKGVEGSSLSESYVIKNQILEYMKYRGPASLGYGMLEKVFAFKDLEKQQKTMEDKLDYEETMSDVQKACEDAYDNIKQYNELLDGSMKPENLEKASYEINEAMHDAIVATWCYSALKRDLQINKNWQNRTSEQNTDVEAAMDRCSKYESMKGLYESFAGHLKDGGFDAHPLAAFEAIKITIGYKEEFDNYQYLFTTWHNYVDYYTRRIEELNSQLDDADEDETESIEEEWKELEEEHKKFKEIYEEAEIQIKNFLSALPAATSTLEEDINKKMSSAVDQLNYCAQEAKKLRELGNLGNSALDKILSEMGNLEHKGQAWQSSISNLSEGDIKTTMQSDYDNKAKELDREKIQILHEKLSNGIAYGDTIYQYAQKAKAVNYQLLNAQKSSYYPYMKSKLENNTTYGTEPNPYNGTGYDQFSVRLWEENAKKTGALTDSACTVYFVNENGETVDGIFKMNLATYISNINNISAKNDEFYKYLERICPDHEADSGEKKEAKEAKENLLKKAQEQDLSANDYSFKTIPAGGEGSSQSFDKTDSTASDKDVSKKAKDNTKASSNFLKDVGNLLVKGRDKLYISEYATQMFSYYTVDKPKSKKEVEETLSGYTLTEAHNYMYKAEVEYILWGNPSGKADVEYTLATIFGIRFLLNSLYAFTGDPEIRSISLALATSIAGWTGFGIPLVQSVIIIGFALAETALDLQTLKDGESVPIYKSTSTWIIKPSGITKEAVGQAINDAVSSAKEYVFNKMDELTEETKGTFKKGLETFGEEKVDNIVSTATATILTPVQERLVGLVNVVSPDPSKISADIDAAISGVQSSIASEPDSILKEAKLKAVDYFNSNYKGMLVSKIQEVQNNEGISNQQITEEINHVIEECQEGLKTQLSGGVKSGIDAATKEVNSVIDSANDQLQEKTSEAVDKMLMRIDCGVSFAELPEGGKTVGKVSTSRADALTMNYKEYLWLFIAVKSIQSEEDMLKRIGILIERNLAESETKPSPDFTISGARTFLEIKADAKLSTTFFSIPVPAQGGGSVSLGQDSYTIGYHGVLGY